ncbi:hypothetical protein QUB11_03755 [Microcoleus sp. B6-A1]|uniref:hypothetical protein n=1 Tax=Microcoleus sp. B6-A1 TaxID=2818684 RepID=UPI002FCEF5F7
MSQEIQNSVPVPNLSDLDLNTDLNTEEVGAQVDEIFDLAISNSWEHEQFAKKILSGCVACNLGYVAIAIELIRTTTGLEPDSVNEILLSFVAQTRKLDTVSINKAHLLFEHGLLLKSIQDEQEQEAL